MRMIYTRIDFSSRPTWIETLSGPLITWITYEVVEQEKAEEKAPEVFLGRMAMAMATTVAGGARILSPFSTVSRSSIAASSSSSSSRVAHLCSSFKGLSVQKWQQSSSGHGGDITDFSGISSSSSVSSGTTTTRKLVFTFAKIKTHKATAKRFRVTGSGKIMRRQARKQHLLSKKNSNRKRRLSKMTQVNRSDYDNIIGALPYLKVKGRLT